MLLVCIACPVSVSVHLVCLGRTKSQGTRDTTPAVCSVSLLLAAAAPALGFDAAFLWELVNRDESLTQESGVRGLRARSNDARRGTGRGDGPRCAVDD